MKKSLKVVTMTMLTFGLSFMAQAVEFKPATPFTQEGLTGYYDNGNTAYISNQAGEVVYRFNNVKKTSVINAFPTATTSSENFERLPLIGTYQNPNYVKPTMEGASNGFMPSPTCYVYGTLVS